VDLTNDRYVILLKGKTWTERYYRAPEGEGRGWVKESAKGNRFPASAEQVLNHLLPALAKVKPGVEVVVEHREAGTP
jgi:hypothetical protein